MKASIISIHQLAAMMQQVIKAQTVCDKYTKLWERNI